VKLAMHCEKLHAFFDGELPADEVPLFQHHLVGCAACQDELREVMVLEALCASLRPTTSRHFATVAPPEAPSSKSIPPPIAGPRRACGAGPWDWKAWLAMAVASILVAAAARRQAKNLGEALLTEMRPFAARVSWDPADRYRPLRVIRGVRELRVVPFDTVARLQASGDDEGLAVAYLLAGVEDDAEVSLSRAPRTAGADNNRAVLAIQRDRWQEARLLLEALLVANPTHAQARWNMGLVLEHLGERAAAARAFEAVAALQEPGWSEEARQRAEALRR
jgi:hypothetical protein